RGTPPVRQAAIAVVGLFTLNLAVGLLNMSWLAPIPLQLVHLLLADLVWIALVVLAAATPAARPLARLPSVVVPPREVLGEHAAAVLVVVAVDAEVLPVAAVGRVVVMVTVAVVDGEQVQVRALELARALGADPAVQGERALAITLLARACCLGGLADE